MKIINLHTHKTLLRKARHNNKAAQKELFDSHAPKMLSVCRQYVKDMHHAEDLMLQGFFKAFKNLKTFNDQGSFEGWLRRIMVNTCINYLRKKNRLKFSDTDYLFEEKATENLEKTSVEDIQTLIDALPDGYKLVFNLYAIEGFKHQEIAKKLNISVSTSKTQLHKARKLLQENYTKMNTSIYDTK